MATGGMYPQNLGQEEHEIIAFLRQNVARHLAYEASVQCLPKTHPRVILAVWAYFNLGPTSHRAFDRLVWLVATGQQRGKWFDSHSTSGFVPCGVMTWTKTTHFRWCGQVAKPSD